MNKYELTLVLNGKLEEEEKAAALEKAQGYITRFNGTVTNVDDWGKKRFAYDIQKMKEGFYYFINGFQLFDHLVVIFCRFQNNANETANIITQFALIDFHFCPFNNA